MVDKKPKPKSSIRFSEQHEAKIERLAKLMFGTVKGNFSKAVAVMVEKYKL